ncbi:MAG: hypothetical protein ACYSWP_20305 [Planctomycetota bacterium]|jgi:hypothetical protein
MIDYAALKAQAEQRADFISAAMPVNLLRYPCQAFFGLQTRLFLDAMTGKTCEFSALQRNCGGNFGYFS